MFGQFISILGVGILVNVHMVHSLKCPECVDDDCKVTQMTFCEQAGVDFNMLSLQQVLNDLQRTRSDTYQCLRLIYKDSEEQVKKQLRACVESGINYCENPTKEGVNIFKCEICESDCGAKTNKEKIQDLEPLADVVVSSLAITLSSNIFYQLLALVIFQYLADKMFVWY